ncbi:MAG: hypothetical protein H3C38_04970 [Rhodospirillales bacterium]|nr:hypothetical protein [Rhodospirillales bacterium]
MTSRLLGYVLAAVLAGAPAAAEPQGLLALPRSVDAIPGLDPAVPQPAPEEQPPPVADQLNYRSLMRDLVGNLAAYAKGRKPSFVVLQQGGFELLVKGDREALWEAQQAPQVRSAPAGAVFHSLLENLDGVLVEGLYCSAAAKNAGASGLAKLMVSEGKRLLVVERCRDLQARSTAAARAERDKALTYFVDDGSQRPPGENATHVAGLKSAANFLVAPTRTLRKVADLISALRESNHDVVIVEPYLGAAPLTAEDVAALQFKRLGSRRLVIAAIPLNTANPERHYWKPDWSPGTPNWLRGRAAGTNTYDVDYWHAEWKEIVGAYLKGVIDLGYDGVLLTGTAAYLDFEATDPSPER